MSGNKTYPPLNMHFTVHFHDKEYKDSQFQSVEGLQAYRETDETNHEPQTRFTNITLTRAYEPDSKLVAWCMDAMNNHKKEPKNLTITLLSPKQKVLGAWIIEQALPVGWGIEELHAQETKVLLECIEISYVYFQVVNSEGAIVSPIPDEDE